MWRQPADFGLEDKKMYKHVKAKEGRKEGSNQENKEGRKKRRKDEKKEGRKEGRTKRRKERSWVLTPSHPYRLHEDERHFIRT